MLDIGEFDGFDWDEGNLHKNWEKQRVSNIECEEAFFNTPLLLHDDPKHSTMEPRYYALGQTSAGRGLFIVFTVRDTQIRIISARPMNRKERQVYEQTNS